MPTYITYMHHVRARTTYMHYVHTGTHIYITNITYLKIRTYITSIHAYTYNNNINNVYCAHSIHTNVHAKHKCIHTNTYKHTYITYITYIHIQT